MYDAIKNHRFWRGAYQRRPEEIGLFHNYTVCCPQKNFSKSIYMSLQRYQGWHCDNLDQFSHHSQLKMATMQFSIVVKSSVGGSFLWSQKTHGTIIGIAFPSKVENWSPATKQNKNYWIWPKIGWVMGSFRPKFDFEKCIWRPSWITWPWM